MSHTEQDGWKVAHAGNEAVEEFFVRSWNLFVQVHPEDGDDEGSSKTFGEVLEQVH